MAPNNHTTRSRSVLSEDFRTKVDFEKFPMVTVIMPIRNEVGYIARSLGAVIDQDYPAERMEIFVVDGMSTDNTLEVVDKLSVPDVNIRVIHNPNKIVPTGLNLALKQANGEIIIRVDGHCEISPDYVRNCVKQLQNEGVDCVGGPLETIGENYLGESIAEAMSSKFGVGDSSFRTLRDHSKYVDTVAFPAYPNGVITNVGLYNEDFLCNEDDEYNFRLRKLGGRILLSPEIRSRYYCRNSLSSLWRQYYKYGYWKVRVMQLHPSQLSVRHFVPAIFLLSLSLTLLLSFISSVGLALFVLILGLYILANLFASILVAARNGWRFLPILPVVYSILHTSYGLGFLIGLIRFAPRWKT